MVLSSYGNNVSRSTGMIKPGTLKINGQPVSDSATYRVCTANYLASGGDGFTSFVLALRDYPGVAKVKNIAVPIWKGVCEYIYDKDIITPLLDGRVKQEGGGVMCGALGTFSLAFSMKGRFLRRGALRVALGTFSLPFSKKTGSEQ
jgi:hypothetical protein